MRTLLTVFLVMALCRCASLSERTNSISFVRTNNGSITHKQADAIAEAYFFQKMSDCGGPGEAKLQGDYWLVPFVIGYAGAPGNYPIAISRWTGAISCPGYPYVKDLVPLLEAQRKDEILRSPR